MKLIYFTLTLVFATVLFANAQKSVSVTVKDTLIAAKDTVPDKPVVTYHSMNVGGKAYRTKPQPVTCPCAMPIINCWRKYFM